MGAIRGAVIAVNTEKDISEKSVELAREIMSSNGLKVSDVQAVFFSVTEDLTACYPAKSVREELGFNNAAFMCFQEMKVEGAISHCIRICVFADIIAQSNCRHCYLGEASVLRSDLTELNE